MGKVVDKSGNNGNIVFPDTVEVPNQMASGSVNDQPESNLTPSRELTGKILLKAEKYIAQLVAPQGNGIVPIDDKVRLLRHLDSDDDFFHVMCHIDQNIMTKIKNGEFIELEKLLPRE